MCVEDFLQRHTGRSRRPAGAAVFEFLQPCLVVPGLGTQCGCLIPTTCPKIPKGIPWKRTSDFKARRCSETAPEIADEMRLAHLTIFKAGQFDFRDVRLRL